MPAAKGFKRKLPAHVMQRTFCENIAAGMKQAPAARNAGYSSPSKAADTLLKKSDIQAQIEQMRDDTRKAGLVTRERSIEGILEAIEHARIVNDPGAMIRGWQELNRMHGYHAPMKVEVDVPEEVRVMLNKLSGASKEKLIELIGEEEETPSPLDAALGDDGTYAVPAYALNPP